jgi:hypothetical protein
MDEMRTTMKKYNSEEANHQQGVLGPMRWAALLLDHRS